SLNLKLPPPVSIQWTHHSAGEMIMRSFSKTIFLLAVFLVAILFSSAQSPLSSLLQSPTTTSTSNSPTDPLNRTTPSGAVLGFLQAAQSGDYSIAAQYLQMTAARRQSEGEQLAAKLKVVLDRAFTGRFNNFTL